MNLELKSNITIDNITINKISGNKFVTAILSFDINKQDIFLYFDNINDFKQNTIFEFRQFISPEPNFNIESIKYLVNEQNLLENDSFYKITYTIELLITENTEEFQIAYRIYVDKKYFQKIYPQLNLEFEEVLYKFIPIIRKSKPTEDIQDFSDIELLPKLNKFEAPLNLSEIKLQNFKGHKLQKKYITDFLISHRKDKSNCFFIIDSKQFAENFWIFPLLTTNVLKDFNENIRFVISDLTTSIKYELEIIQFSSTKNLYRFQVPESKNEFRKIKINFFINDPTIKNLQQLVNNLIEVNLRISEGNITKAIELFETDLNKLFFENNYNSVINALKTKKQLDKVSIYIQNIISYIKINYDQYFDVASSAGNPYILVSNDGDSFIQQFLDKTVFFEQQPLSHVSPLFMADSKISKSNFILTLTENTKNIFGVENGNFQVGDKQNIELQDSKFGYLNLDLSRTRDHFEIKNNKFDNIYDIFSSVLNPYNEDELSNKYYDIVKSFGLNLKLKQFVKELIVQENIFEVNKPKETKQIQNKESFSDISNALIEIILTKIMKDQYVFFDSKKYNLFEQASNNSSFVKTMDVFLPVINNLIFGDNNGFDSIPNSLKFLFAQFGNTKPKISIDVFKDTADFLKMFLYPIFFFKFLYCFRIEYLESSSDVNNLKWKLLDFNSLQNNDKLFCRIIYYENDKFIPRQLLEKFKLEIYNKYFLID